MYTGQLLLVTEKDTRRIRIKQSVDMNYVFSFFAFKKNSVTSVSSMLGIAPIACVFQLNQVTDMENVICGASGACVKF